MTTVIKRIQLSSGLDQGIKYELNADLGGVLALSSYDDDYDRDHSNNWHQAWVMVGGTNHSAQYRLDPSKENDLVYSASVVDFRWKPGVDSADVGAGPTECSLYVRAQIRMVGTDALGGETEPLALENNVPRWQTLDDGTAGPITWGTQLSNGNDRYSIANSRIGRLTNTSNGKERFDFEFKATLLHSPAEANGGLWDNSSNTDGFAASAWDWINGTDGYERSGFILTYNNGIGGQVESSGLGWHPGVGATNGQPFRRDRRY